MRYFYITQDVNLPCSIRFRDFDITKGRRFFGKEDAEKLRDTAVVYLAGDGTEARPDLIQHPVLMFSKRLQDILDAFEADLVFKDVVLIHKESLVQYRYIQVLMEEIDGAGSRSEYYPNGEVKRLVLDHKKVENYHLFLLKGRYRRDPIVSLPLAESLLRRNVAGICLEEVEVDGDDE